MERFHTVLEPHPTGIETIDDIPTILVETAPNGITRRFRTNEIITRTPHIEIMGRDLTSYVGRCTIDSPTEKLLESIRSLGEDVKSVTIEPYQVSVDGPTIVNEQELLRGAWPQDLELKITLTIAEHLRCEHGVLIERRTISEEELWERIRAIQALSGHVSKNRQR